MRKSSDKRLRNSNLSLESLWRSHLRHKSGLRFGNLIVVRECAQFEITGIHTQESMSPMQAKRVAKMMGAAAYYCEEMRFRIG